MPLPATPLSSLPPSRSLSLKPPVASRRTSLRLAFAAELSSDDGVVRVLATRALTAEGPLLACIRELLLSRLEKLRGAL